MVNNEHLYEEKVKKNLENGNNKEFNNEDAGLNVSPRLRSKRGPSDRHRTQRGLYR